MDVTLAAVGLGRSRRAAAATETRRKVAPDLGLADRHDNAAGRAAGQRHGDELARDGVAVRGLGLLGVVRQSTAVGARREVGGVGHNDVGRCQTVLAAVRAVEHSHAVDHSGSAEVDLPPCRVGVRVGARAAAPVAVSVPVDSTVGLAAPADSGGAGGAAAADTVGATAATAAHVVGGDRAGAVGDARVECASAGGEALDEVALGGTSIAPM